jgi:DNA helicase-2/ATP-dependent DNA helicase PcrA
MPAEPSYLDGLNPEQRLAVETTEGPVLVLAGAGTGKTRVLTTRIAHLLGTGRAYPSQILSTTFTNKAAKEMRERVARITGQPTEGLWLGTFHSLCSRMLRRHAELVGLSQQFIIIDADDQHRLLKQLMQEWQCDDKKWPARVCLSIIQIWKDRALTPDKVAGTPEADYADRRMPELYLQYQQRLKTSNAVDFGDLLLHMLTIFQAHPEVLAEYSRKFRYMLVDEYQDTNIAQYLWLRLLAMTHKNLCCVGDDDQSIYSWRGAEVGNILKFEKDFPGAAVIRLERNYRSTEHILGAASHLIANNRERLGKTLHSVQGSGEKIIVRSLWDDTAEAVMVAEEIDKLQRKKTSLSDMAVLVRAGFQTRAFEEKMLSFGIPYRVVGGLRFYERQEIRDVLAYLRVIVQPDDDLAFQRIVNLPKRGIGKTTLDALGRIASQAQTSIHYAISHRLVDAEISAGTANKLRDFARLCEVWRAKSTEEPPAEFIQRVIEESGYRAMWQAERTPDAAGRLENLKELVRAVGEFETLESFLEHVSLVSELDNADASTAMVSIMTLHAAKGLEFDCVFLPGWEEGLFPHQKSLEEKGGKGLEEERRLAYVGITRARKQAWISHAANRRIYNQWQSSLPSRFIQELPKEHLEVIDARGLSSRSEPLSREQIAAIVSEASAPRVKTSPVTLPPAGGFNTGQRVFHETFGYGKVLGQQGQHLHIQFEKAGTKRMLQDFVKRC